MASAIIEVQRKDTSSLLLGLGGPIFVFLLALFLFARPFVLLGDGGTCRHFLTGLFIAQHHALPVTNYMSALEPNAPWVTHELLCDLIFGLPFPQWGMNWVVLTSSIAIALSFAWSYQMGRMRGSGLLPTLLVMLVAMEACTVHWSARPHVFSYLLFLACYYVCFLAHASIKKTCIYLGTIFFLWANLHGSFPLGLMMVGMRIAGDLWERLLAVSSVSATSNLALETGGKFESAQGQSLVAFSKPESAHNQPVTISESESARDQQIDAFSKSEPARDQSVEAASKSEPRNYPLEAVSSVDATDDRQDLPEKYSAWGLKGSILIVVSCVVACCLNVRGASFLTYVYTYLTSPKIQFHSDEWRSLDFSLGLPAWSFLLLCFVMFITWVYSKSKPRIGEFLFMSALLCSSIYAMRLVPYFALAVLPAVGAQIAYFQQSKLANALPILKSVLAVDRQASFGEIRSAKNAWVHSVFAIVIALAFLFAPNFKVPDMDPMRMPVGASNYLKEHHVTGLGFTKDNWGSYLYWKLGEPIFLDDKTDFYSQKLLDDYMTIFMSKPGWPAVLDSYKFKYILIPTGLPLQYDLQKSAQWKEVFNENGTVLFLPADSGS